MKQTAVEWLAKEIEGLDTGVSHQYFKEKVEQAKEIFEQQIKHAYRIGYISMNTSEQYYNETFKSK